MSRFPSGGPAPTRQVDKLLAVASHLSWVVGLPILVPLVIYLLRLDTPFVRQHAAEALNFHITTAIYAAISALLLLVVIGFVLLPLVGLFFLVFTIIAAVKAADGQPYRYPLTLHLVH